MPPPASYSSPLFPQDIPAYPSREAKLDSTSLTNSAIVGRTIITPKQDDLKNVEDNLVFSFDSSSVIDLKAGVVYESSSDRDEKFHPYVSRDGAELILIRPASNGRENTSVTTYGNEGGVYKFKSTKTKSDLAPADLNPPNLTSDNKVLGNLRRINIEGMPDLIAKTSKSLFGDSTVFSDVFLPMHNLNNLINVGINSDLKYSEIDNPIYRPVGFHLSSKTENPKAILLSNDNFGITISSTGLPISIEYKTQPELRTSNYPASVDPGSGFKFYESNTSDLLRSLKSINGKSIDEIERSARREFDFNDHLLGLQESLIDLMIEDNDYVLEAGFKHIDLAEPLMLFFDLAKNLRDIDLKNIEYNGSRFSVYCDTMSAAPNDPFQTNDTRDSCYPGNGNITVLKEGSDCSLSYSGLNAHLIAAYGFYEGKAEEVGGFRLDPEDLIEFFNLKPKQNTIIENT